MYLKKIVAILILTVVVCSNTSARVLNLLTIEYAPFYSKTLKNNGPLAEIIRRSFEKNRIDIEVKFTSWKAAMKQVKDGHADGLFTMWYKKSREKNFTFSQPIYPSELGFVVLRESKINSAEIADIKDKRLGVIDGYLMPKEFKLLFSKIKKASNESDNIKRLAAGRVDMIYGDRVELVQRGEQEGYLVKWLYPPYRIHQQHLVLGNHVADRKFLIKKFNQGLNELIESGEYCTILKNGSLHCPKYN